MMCFHSGWMESYVQESSDVSPDKQRFLSWAPGPAAHSAVRQTETAAPRLPLGCCYQLSWILHWKLFWDVAAAGSGSSVPCGSWRVGVLSSPGSLTFVQSKVSAVHTVPDLAAAPESPGLSAGQGGVDWPHGDVCSWKPVQALIKLPAVPTVALDLV